MPKVDETTRVRNCPRCKTQCFYEKTNLGWVTQGDACFEIGEWWVDIVCPSCGWKMGTQIRPKNVVES
jgi:hypothetical protein